MKLDQASPGRNSTGLNDLLVLGLGNPGPEYQGTRHNLGAACVDALAARLGTSLSRRRWRSLVGSADVQARAEGEGSRHRLWLAFPQTFMNESGRAAAAAVRDLGLQPAQIWVVYDELDLPLCRLRIRRGGSSAGHNGLKSLIAHLHSDDFVRFRVGVGRPQSERTDPVDHLLDRFRKSELPLVDTVVQRVVEALEIAATEGLSRAMDTFNRAGSLGCEDAAR